MADKQQPKGQPLEPSRQRREEQEREQEGTSRLASGRAQRSEGLAPWRGGGSLIGTPFTFMRRMFEDMDRLFGEFGLGPEAPMRAEAPLTWAPEVEIFRRDGELVVRADLPGIKAEDLQVRVDEDQLVIEGERRVEHEEKVGEVCQTERFYGTFSRRIALPRGIDASSVNANLDSGVLEISMRLPAERKRTVEIRSAGQPARAAQQPPTVTTQEQPRQETGAPPTDRNGAAPAAPSRH